MTQPSKLYPAPGREMNPDISFRLGRRLYGIEIYEMDEDSNLLASGSTADPEYQRGWADACRHYGIGGPAGLLEPERETVIIRIQATGVPGEYAVEAKGRRTYMDRAGIDEMLRPLLLTKYRHEPIPNGQSC